MADTVEDILEQLEDARKRALAAWIVGLVQSNEDVRDSEYKRDWERFFRTWLGRFGRDGIGLSGGNATGTVNGPGRSRLVSPATMAAIDSTVAELEEALLNKPEFVDLRDDEIDLYNNKTAEIEQARRLVNYDLETCGMRQEAAKALTIGSIFGTAALKGIVSFEEELELPVDRNSEVGNPVKKFKVRPVAVRPDKIVVDEDAENVADQSFQAYVDYLPVHVVQAENPSEQIDKEIRKQYFVADPTSRGDANTARYIEFYGLVPANLLEETPREAAESLLMDISDPEDDIEIAVEADEAVMVEAIVKIANDNKILSAEENPFWMKERLLKFYRHEIVPGRFWGRGIAEKGDSPQKALSAMLRAQMDSLALTVYPMIAINSGMFNIRSNFSVRPGKSIPVNGNPNEAFAPFRFGQVDPQAFAQTQNLESMVSAATGGLDAIGPTTIDPSRASTGGIGMVSSSIIKRAARPIRNAGDEMIAPFAAMVARLHMQFDDERYPLVDLRFKASAGLGLVAKELAKQELVALINTVPAQSPAYWAIVKEIIELSGATNRDEILTTLDAQIEAAANPQPTPEQQLAQQQLELAIRQTRVQEVRSIAELERIKTDRLLANSTIAEKDSKVMLNIAKAEAEEAGTQIGEYQQLLEELKANAGELDETSAPDGDNDGGGADTSLLRAIEDAGLAVGGGEPTDAT